MFSIISVGLNIYFLFAVRILEIFLGSNAFASLILTNFIFYVVIKYAVFYSNCYANGPFFVSASLLCSYWSNSLSLF